MKLLRPLAFCLYTSLFTLLCGVLFVVGTRHRFGTEPYNRYLFVIPNNASKPDCYAAVNHSSLRYGPLAKTTTANQITVILTVYKRGQILEEQIFAILRQSLQPSQIVIWQNGNFTDITAVVAKFPNVSHVHSKHINYKFYGRFLLPLMVDTEYVIIFDDDTIPGVSMDGDLIWCDDG
jgi:hypothetical protein